MDYFEEINSGPWTEFWDMHSGGGCKNGFEYIYIRSDRNGALAIFRNVFTNDPENETCRCCGQDYAISESDDLMTATAYQRGDYRGSSRLAQPQTMREFADRDDVRIITNPDGTM